MSERSIRRARQRRGAKLAAGGATFGAAALFAPAAQADTFVVDTNADNVDGACTPADCTLRDAVVEANNAGGDDVVTFASNVTGEIEVDDGGDIDVYGGGLQILGPGANVLTLSGEDDNRIFKLFGFDEENTPVEISGLTLDNGYGFLYGGGAILNSNTNAAGDPVPYAADLTISDAVLSDNRTSTLGGPYDYEDGGAIASRDGGDVTVTNSQLAGNYAYDGGGAVYVDDASLTITGSTISDNAAGDEGGGSYLDDPGDDEQVLIADSTFTGNDADGDGGAIYLDEGNGGTIERTVVSGNSAGGTDGGGGIYINNVDGPFTVRDSAIYANQTETDGGGIYINNVNDDTTIERTTIFGNSADDGGGVYNNNANDSLRIVNSTISGNAADEGSDGEGGGVYVQNVDPDTLAVINSTITGNSATVAGGGIFVDYNYGGNDTEVSSSIVTANTAPDGPDLGHRGTYPGGFELGFSLIGSTAGADTTESPAGSNLIGLDPQLGPLASNGGLTQTHAPALTSPVLDAGIANGLAQDQRGLARLSDLALVANRPGSDATDIGSVEIQAAEVEAQCKGVTVRRLAGGSGDDTITGTAAPEAIFGLDGRDRLSGAGGADCVNGDAGRDKLKGNGGKDVVRGGPGKDNVKGQGGKDKLRGQGGKDKLVGGGAKDNLKGGAGKDKLRGGPAKDKLKGQGGKDKINAVDGKRDKVNCGGSKKDRTTVDAEDKVSGNCETVIVKD